MKYRLLKPLGGLKPGTIYDLFEPHKDGLPDGEQYLRCKSAFGDLPAELATDPDWFEEVKAFVPKASETFWYIGAPLVPMIAVLEGLGSDFSEDILKIGNCFRTEADAESCAVEMRKLLKQWREDHP